jgi:CheY-like chemotaxis protein
MSDAGGNDPTPQMTRALCHAVAQALETGASARALERARELAEVASLPGLARLLTVLTPHAGGLWPMPLRPAVDRVQRAVAEGTRHESLDPLRRLDQELALMARAIERVPSSRFAPPQPEAPARPAWPSAETAVVPLAELIEGVQAGSADVLRRVRLHAPVAGALRAALDWLVGAGGVPRPRTWLTSDGSALDVTCEGIAYTGVQPAAEVLENVGAHLGPAGERPGAWTVRVPIVAERETFLMIEQDELQLAVPWHAVVRVRMIPAATIETMVHRQGLPVLKPLAVAERRALEQPVLVVALGLKRACLVADRLIWRMSAEPAEAPGRPPAEGIGRAVRSDDGDVYWVLDPAWLLRGVAAPPLGQPARRGSAPEPAGPTASPRPIPSPPLPPLPISGPQAVPAPADPEPVEAHEEPSTTFETAPPTPTESTACLADAPPSETMPSDAAPPAIEAPPSAMEEPPPAPELPTPSSAVPPSMEANASRGPRRALVAEDSITARIFLVRLLEQRGFLVHAVASARELREWLPRGPWALVCADCVLPDIQGAEFLREISQQAEAAPFPLVALVRDAADESAARASGIVATLRKPFEREALEILLSRLSSEAAGGSRNDGGMAPDPREWGAR